MGQVSCGSAHTLVVSRDNKTVWSLICFTLFTGHGDSNSKNLPTKVKDLPPVVINLFYSVYRTWGQ